jgi:hypothetical protein
MELDHLPTSVAGVLELLDERLETYLEGKDDRCPPMALWLAQMILQNLGKATDVAAMKRAIWEPMLLFLRQVKGFEQCVDEWEQFWPRQSRLLQPSG